MSLYGTTQSTEQPDQPYRVASITVDLAGIDPDWFIGQVKQRIKELLESLNAMGNTSETEFNFESQEDGSVDIIEL